MGAQIRRPAECAGGDRITLIRGRARLLPDGAVALDDGRTITSTRIVIATGAEPHILPLGGIKDVQVLTSTSAMALPELPRSIVVVGGRAVALELGQTFARFGAQVTILQRSPRLIPGHEPELICDVRASRELAASALRCRGTEAGDRTG